MAITTQMLSDRQTFFKLGLAEGRVPPELVDETPSDNSTIEYWIAAGSGEVLRHLSPFMTFPLISWGNDVERWVCSLAADIGKTVCGLPADSVEYQQIIADVAQIRAQLALIRRREDCPQGVIDSTPEDTQRASVPRMFGYAKQALDMF